VNRVRLAFWTMLVAVIAGLNYVSRFSNNSSTNRNGNEIYSWADFAAGASVYVFWLLLVLAIAVERYDLLALRRPTSWPRALGICVLAVITIFVVEGLVSYIPLPQSPGKEQGLTPSHWEPAHAGAFAANVFLFCAIAPFVEELMFRGLGQSLLRFVGRYSSMLLVGTAFGLSHGLVEGLLVLIPFGVVLAFVRDETDSAVPGMFVHSLFNSIAIAVSVLR